MKKQKTSTQIDQHTLAFTPEIGDIIFSAKSGPISWAIRFFFGPFAYSHVCIAGEIIDGEATVYTTGLGGKEKNHSGFLPQTHFRRLDAGNYLQNKTYVVCRYEKDGHEGLSEAQKDIILKWCHSQLGKKYPFRKTGKYFKKIFKAAGINQLKAKGQNNLYTCYEAVVVAYSQLGIELNPRAAKLDSSGYDIKEIFLSPFLTDVYKSKNDT